MTPPPKSPDDIAENKTNPPSSPTSTIRNVPVSLMQPVTEASTESEASTPLAGPGDVSGMRGTTAQQQKLGMGRPGGGSNVVGVNHPSY